MKTKILLACCLVGTLLLEACSPPTPPPTTAVPQTATEAPPTKTKAPPPPTWTPTSTSTPLPTALPRSTSRPQLTRTPYPTRTPFPTRTATVTPTATITGSTTISMTPTVSGTEVLTGTAATEPISGTATATPEPQTKTLIGDFDNDRALALIYNNPQASAYVNTVLSVTFSQAEQTKIFLIAEVPGDNCLTCKAGIGGAVLVQEGSAWTIEAEQRNITMMGSYGHAPTGELVEIGPDRYGLLFFEVYTETAQFSERAVLIAPIESSIHTVLSVQTAAGALKGGEIEWAYHSKITFTPVEGKDYHKLVLTTSGSRPFDDTIKTFETTSVYLFARSEFHFSESDEEVGP